MECFNQTRLSSLTACKNCYSSHTPIANDRILSYIEIDAPYIWPPYCNFELNVAECWENKERKNERISFYMPFIGLFFKITIQEKDLLNKYAIKFIQDKDINKY